jgi:glycosyltransferase involved in cell wall biosynthesis
VGAALFIGTLEPRKNLGALLDAYERLIRSAEAFALQSVPELIVAGKADDGASDWIDRMKRPPLNAHVRHIGYVDPSGTRDLYAGARMLVVPSYEEGFGIPVLEAMTLGVPVVAARRGALPEVLGDAGQLVDPERPEDIAGAIARLLQDEAFRSACVTRGLARARTYRWSETARCVLTAYQQAIEHHAHRR